MFHIFIARDKSLCVMFKKILLDGQGKLSDILLPRTGCMNNLTLNIQCSKPVQSYVLRINLKNTKRKVKSNQKNLLIQQSCHNTVNF